MERKMFDYYSNVRQRKAGWLWFPYISYGKLTVLQGDPSDGKSTFILQVASLLSEGLQMPDGYRVKESRSIDVDKLLSEESEYGNKRTVAGKYLEELLNAQDMASNEIYDKMQRMGIGKRTAANAKQKMKVTSYRKSGAWYWKLPTTPGMETQTMGGGVDE